MNFVANSSSVRSGSAFGEDVTFTCTVDSWPLASVNWSYNGGLDSRISTQTSQPSSIRQVSTLTFLSVEQEDDGSSFTCTATSQYGVITSSGSIGIFGELVYTQIKDIFFHTVACGLQLSLK